jgi:RNA polymerase sigma-70 factor (ECF subfamily)
MATLVTTPTVIRISSVGGEHPEQTARQAPSASRAEVESDEALAIRAREGSLAAFGTLVDRYERRLIGFLSQRASGQHAAEDLAQETFVRAWRRLDTFDPERRFSTWLFTIGARLAADDYRRRKRERTGAEKLGRLQSADSTDTGERAGLGDV